MTIEIKKQDLDELIMIGDHLDRHLSEMKQYFSAPAGLEHYRLLVHLSRELKDSWIVDVGTYKGSSALAFSVNTSNKIVSYNIENQLDVDFSDIPNVKFVIGDVYNDTEVLRMADLILFDIAPHDGVMEMRFYHHLVSIGFKGIVLFDDIHLNDGMNKFWDSIIGNKIDLTSVGHGSGTGAIFFGPRTLILK